MDDILILPPSSKAIPLSQGKYAIVDEDDYEWLMQWKWHCDKGYATRFQYHEGDKKEKRRKIRINMHRLIAQTPEGMQTDHINGNSLDNRRCNLRVCTTMQNQQNQKPRTGGSSKYKGVSWNKRDSRWTANIKADGIGRHLGYFTSEKDAAQAYNAAATKYFGEFAKINMVEAAPDRIQTRQISCCWIWAAIFKGMVGLARPATTRQRKTAASQRAGYALSARPLHRQQLATAQIAALCFLLRNRQK